MASSESICCVGLGLFGPSMGLTLPALRAPGPACRCPKLLCAVSSNRRIRSPPLSARYAKRPARERFVREHSLALGAWDCSAHPWASPFRAARPRPSLSLSEIALRSFVEPEDSFTTALRQIRKTPRQGALRQGAFVGVGGVGLFGPSMGLPLPRSALQGQPAAVRNCSRQFRRTGGFVHTSLRQIRKTPRQGALRQGASVGVGGVGLFGPSMGLPLPRSALQGQPAAVRNCSRQFRRTGGFVHHLSPPDTQNAPLGGVLRIWRRERDSNPR